MSQLHGLSQGLSNVELAVLLLLSLFCIDPAGAQAAPRNPPAWVLSVHGDQLTANLNRIPLRLVLEELARQAPLRLSVSEGLRDHPVTANFRALPLDEALERLLAGLSYAVVYAPALSGAGSAATRQIVELMVLEKAPTVTSNTGTGIETTPELTATLEDPDKQVRLEALQRWAEQGAATPLNPLTQALVDADESVRAKAQELVERVWAAKAR